MFQLLGLDPGVNCRTEENFSEMPQFEMQLRVSDGREAKCNENRSLWGTLALSYYVAGTNIYKKH